MESFSGTVSPPRTGPLYRIGLAVVAFAMVLLPIVAEVQSRTDSLQARLKEFPYPFAHARSPLNVAEYARSETPAETEWQRTYLDGGSHIERLIALHSRLLGRVLAVVDTVERTVLER